MISFVFRIRQLFCQHEGEEETLTNSDQRPPKRKNEAMVGKSAKYRRLPRTKMEKQRAEIVCGTLETCIRKNMEAV